MDGRKGLVLGLSAAVLVALAMVVFVEREQPVSEAERAQQGGPPEMVIPVPVDDEHCADCYVDGDSCTLSRRYGCAGDPMSMCGDTVPCEPACCTLPHEHGLDRGPWSPWFRGERAELALGDQLPSWTARPPEDGKGTLYVLADLTRLEEAVAVAEWDSNLSDFAWSGDGRWVFAIHHGRGNDDLELLEVSRRRFFTIPLELGPLLDLEVLADEAGPRVVVTGPEARWVLQPDLAESPPRLVTVPQILERIAPRWRGEAADCMAESAHPKGAFWTCWAQPAPTLRLIDERSNYAMTAMRGLFFDPGEPPPLRFSADGRLALLSRYEAHRNTLELIRVRDLDSGAPRLVIGDAEVIDYGWAPLEALFHVDLGK
ncbi:MAG: hypothetical protein KC457_14170 [Myxococcales bacterium]|nr:hypothetical protein [Myxococcales bacterium]